MDRKHHLGELQYAIMRVLWEASEASASAVGSALPPEHRRAPTTIATMLSKMERKGVCAHRVEGRHFLYRPLVTEREVRRTMVSELTRRLFRGSAAALVTHLLTEQEIDDVELQELLERFDRPAGDGRARNERQEGDA